MTPDLEENSLGRTYCLWLLARACGWQSAVVSFKGARIWEPLAGHPEFAAACARIDSREELTDAAAGARLIISVKPLPNPLFAAVECADELGIPWLVDIDDPDLEGRLRWTLNPRRYAKEVLLPRTMHDFRVARKTVRGVRPIVSNPTLAERYPGGPVIPHVRNDPGAGSPHTSGNPTVAFVGTPRPHKGLPALRASVAQLAPQGFSLTVTAPEPPDARPWETWVGTTTLGEGIELVRAADIVALPSDRDRYAVGQLPAKLMDAMLLGRAVIVSDVAPMPWAVGDAGTVIHAGSTSELTAALERFASPEARQAAGDRARTRALGLFTVESATEAFRHACTEAMSASRR